MLLYFKQLLSDYKNELNEIIVDKQLVAELQFDLRQMKKDNKTTRLSMTPQLYRTNSLNTNTPGKSTLKRTQSTPVQSTPAKTINGFKTPATVSKTPINNMLTSLMTPKTMQSPNGNFAINKY